MTTMEQENQNLISTQNATKSPSKFGAFIFLLVICGLWALWKTLEYKFFRANPKLSAAFATF